MYEYVYTTKFDEIYHEGLLEFHQNTTVFFTT